MTLFACLEEGYRKAKLPHPAPTAPVNVSVLIHIEELVDFNEHDRTMTLIGYFLFSWKDSRIITKADRPKEYDHLYLDSTLIDLFWKPDIFIKSLVEFQEAKVMEKSTSLTIEDSHTLVLYVPARVTVSCELFLEMYPLDTQGRRVHKKKSSHTCM